MKRLAKILLFVICLITAFLVSVAIANAQVAPVKNSTSVKNILSEIVRSEGANNPLGARSRRQNKELLFLIEK